MRHYHHIIERNSIPLQGNRFEREESFYSKHEVRSYSEAFWNGCGVVLDNRYPDRGLFSSEEGHCLINAGTGAGKTRRILIPTAEGCIKQRKSIFAIDPKGELRKHLTEGLLSYGYDILVYDLRHPRESNHYNPLAIIEKYYHSDSKEDRDWALMVLRDIIYCLANNLAGKEPYFATSPAEFAFGISLMILDSCLEPGSLSFGNIAYVSKDFEEWVRNGGLSASDVKWRRYKEYYNSLPSDIQNSIKSFLQSNAKSTFENLISMLYTILAPFIGNRALLEMMSSSDLDFSEMGRRPIAVFVIVPDETTAYYPIVALMLSEAYMSLLKDVGDDGVLRNKVVFLLDEFGTLCSNSASILPQFSAWVSASRSRGISLMIVLQSFSQLEKGYPDHYETILNNMAVSIFMRGSSIDDLEYIERIGGNRISRFGGDVTSLIPKEKIMTMPIGMTLIRCSNSRPFMGYVRDFTELDYELDKSPFERGRIIAPGKSGGQKVTWESLMDDDGIEVEVDEDEITADIENLFETVRPGYASRLPHKDSSYLEALALHMIPRKYIVSDSDSEVREAILREILLFQIWKSKKDIIEMANTLINTSNLNGYPQSLKQAYKDALETIESMSFREIMKMIEDLKDE